MYVSRRYLSRAITCALLPFACALASAEQIQAILADGCTTPGTAYNSTCSVTITWPASFIDTNYLVNCMVTAVTPPPTSEINYAGFDLEVPFSANTTTTSTVVVRNLIDLSYVSIPSIQCIGVRP